MSRASAESWRLGVAALTLVSVLAAASRPVVAPAEGPRPAPDGPVTAGGTPAMARTTSDLAHVGCQPAATSALVALAVKRVLGAGESQSAVRAVSYIDAVHVLGEAERESARAGGGGSGAGVGVGASEQRSARRARAADGPPE